MAQWTEQVGHQPAPLKPTPPVTSPPEYKGRVYDTRYTPVKEILPYLEGSPWMVEYYGQILNQSSQLGGTTTAKENVYSPVRRIRNLVLRVTSPLSNSQDATTKEVTITGTALVYGGWVPNAGDLFIADIGDGRDGHFMVVNTERLSIMKDAAFRIEYEQRGYVTPAILADLNAKTIEKKVFIHDYMTYGRNPIVSEDKWTEEESLRDEYERILEDWARYFFSKDYSVFIVPSQARVSYDHFVAKAARKFFESHDHPNFKYARVLNAQEDVRMEDMRSIFDVLRSQDERMLKKAFSKVYLTASKFFDPRPAMSGISYSFIPYVVYPENGELTVESSYRDRPKRRLGELSGIAEPLTGVEADQLPPITPCGKDGWYVLSEAFWRGEDILTSKLEVEVRRYLRKDANDVKAIREVIDSYDRWSLLDKFYQTLVLLVIIDAAIWRE